MEVFKHPDVLSQAEPILVYPKSSGGYSSPLTRLGAVLRLSRSFQTSHFTGEQDLATYSRIRPGLQVYHPSPASLTNICNLIHQMF